METGTPELIERNVAVLLLYNDQGEVLLQHRSADAQRFPNHWGFFGGGIEAEEEPREAMMRELREELEYDSKNAEYFSGTEFSTATNRGIVHMFIEKIDPSQKLVQHEGQGMGWFNPLHLESIQTISHDRPIIESVGVAFKEKGILK